MPLARSSMACSCGLGWASAGGLASSIIPAIAARKQETERAGVVCVLMIAIFRQSRNIPGTLATWPIRDAAWNTLAHHFAGRTQPAHDLVDGDIGVHVSIAQQR